MMPLIAGLLSPAFRAGAELKPRGRGAGGQGAAELSPAFRAGAELKQRT